MHQRLKCYVGIKCSTKKEGGGRMAGMGRTKEKNEECLDKFGKCWNNNIKQFLKGSCVTRIKNAQENIHVAFFH